MNAFKGATYESRMCRRLAVASIAVPVAIVGLLAASSSSAPAGAVVVSQPSFAVAASTCTPDEFSSGKYDVHVGGFKHRGTATGEIVTRCNIVNVPLGTGPNKILEVSYTDQDGEGNAQRVVVDLIQNDRLGATKILNRFDSNAYWNTTRVARKSFPATYDFNAYSYYLDIRVYRTNTNTYPIANSVRLTTGT